MPMLYPCTSSRPMSDLGEFDKVILYTSINIHLVYAGTFNAFEEQYDVCR
jgi:hypothetical protein